MDGLGWAVGAKLTLRGAELNVGGRKAEQRRQARSVGRRQAQQGSSGSWGNWGGQWAAETLQASRSTRIKRGEGKA